MTAEEQKQQYLSLINQVKNDFLLENLRAPNDDLVDLEARFQAILKTMRVYDKWPDYFSNALKIKGVVPERNIFLPENRQLYIEIVTEFLDGLYTKIAAAPTTEPLPTQNVPLEEIRTAIKEQKLLHARVVQSELKAKKRWLELIKKHNEFVYAQLVAKLPEVEPDVVKEATRIVIVHYQQQRIAQAVEGKAPTDKNNRQLAQKAIETMRRHYLPISTDQQNKIIETTVAIAKTLDATTTPESWIGLPTPDNIDQVSALAAHLEQGINFLQSAPATNSEIQKFQRAFPRGSIELKRANLAPEQLLTTVGTIINLQRFHPDVKKLDSAEAVSILATGLRQVLHKNKTILADQTILSLLALIYDSPHLPEKVPGIRTLIQTASFSNIPPLWEKTAFRDWLQRNQDQLNQHLDFWQQFLSSPFAAKVKDLLIPNLNLLPPDWLMRLRDITRETTMSVSRSFFSQFGQYFKGLWGKISLGPSVNSAIINFGRSLFGWAGKGLTTLLGWGARLAAGATATTTIGVPVWAIVLLVVVALFLLGFLPGFSSSFDTITAETAALLPPSQKDIYVLPGAAPWVPPGGGGYIDPAGCDQTYSDAALGCCVPNEGYCSMDYLEPYFGKYGVDDLVAASKICFKESVGGLAGVVNDSCLPCIPNADGKCTSGRAVTWPIQTLDYSVGLFQINLIAEGNCGIEPLPGIGGPGDCYTKNPNDPLMKTGCCRITNRSALEACYQKYADPVTNILRALSKVKLDPDGTIDWYPTWGAAKTCGYD